VAFNKLSRTCKMLNTRSLSPLILVAFLIQNSCPRSINNQDSVIAGVWCDSVPQPTNCPPPPIQGGEQLAPACNALVVSRPVGGWPFQMLTAIPGDDCENKLVLANPNIPNHGGFPCGPRELAVDECTPHVAWDPFN
jgi:hypothetical protein